jgi:hypothetical protein
VSAHNSARLLPQVFGRKFGRLRRRCVRLLAFGNTIPEKIAVTNAAIPPRGAAAANSSARQWMLCRIRQEPEFSADRRDLRAECLEMRCYSVAARQLVGSRDRAEPVSILRDQISWITEMRGAVLPGNVGHERLKSM